MRVRQRGGTCDEDQKATGKTLIKRCNDNAKGEVGYPTGVDGS